MRGENAMDRVEKMLGRMKASKLYRCVDWDPEGKAKDLVDKFNSASRSDLIWPILLISISGLSGSSSV
jgi:hypothetical protein